MPCHGVRTGSEKPVLLVCTRVSFFLLVSLLCLVFLSLNPSVWVYVLLTHTHMHYVFFALSLSLCVFLSLPPEADQLPILALRVSY